MLQIGIGMPRALRYQTSGLMRRSTALSWKLRSPVMPIMQSRY